MSLLSIPPWLWELAAVSWLRLSCLEQPAQVAVSSLTAGDLGSVCRSRAAPHPAFDLGGFSAVLSRKCHWNDFHCSFLPGPQQHSCR